MSEARDRMLRQHNSGIFADQQESKSSFPANRPAKDEFVPKYAEMDSKAMRYQQLYGDRLAPQAPNLKENARQDIVEEDIVARRRGEDQNSKIFGQKKSDDFYYRQRREEIPETPSSYQGCKRGSPGASINITPNHRDEDECAKRYQNKNYSDMFDRDFGKPGKSEPVNIPVATAKWSDSDTFSKHNYDDYDWRQFRGQQQRSILDKEIKMAPQKPVLEPEPRPQRTQDEVITFSVSGLSPYDFEKQIRAAAKGVHIVAINPNVNNISGACNGTAQVAIRNGHERFRLNVAYAGYGIQEVEPEMRSRTSTTSKDNWMSTNQVPVNGDIDAESIRKRNESTTDNVFGGNKGCGKWHGEIQRNEDWKDRETFFSWQRTKKS